MKRTILIPIFALTALVVHSQSLPAGVLGFVVGRFQTNEALANFVFCHFDSGNTSAVGTVGSLGNSDATSGIEKVAVSEGKEFHIDGRTINIDADKAASGVKLHTIDGCVVYTGNASMIAVDDGIYILGIGNYRHKIIVY